MKKTLLSLAGLALVSAAFLWGVNAQQLDISELFSNGAPLVDDAYSKVLTQYDTARWYLNDVVVTCDSNNNTVNVVSPVVFDGDYYEVPSYRLFLSPYRIDQLKSWDSSVDQSKIIIKEVERDAASNEIKISVGESDGLDPNQTYYGFVLPINDFDVVWTPTKEVCFQLNNNVCLQDSACDTLWLVANPSEATSSDESDVVEDFHWASCVWMDMANVTHTVKNGVVTLKWTAVDGDTEQVAIFDPENEVYKSLWAVSMKDEKFEYKMEWDGEQNFMLTNGCKELYYKADAKKESEPEKIVPPATGPAENILYVAIAAIILYGAYVVFFRKADNK